MTYSGRNRQDRSPTLISTRTTGRNVPVGSSELSCKPLLSIFLSDVVEGSDEHLWEPTLCTESESDTHYDSVRVVRSCPVLFR